MKRITLILIALLFISTSLFAQSPQEVTVSTETEVSTFYLIRHAEKDRSNPLNKNPDLTTAGHERAIKWRDVLGQIQFDAIYTTDFNRTKQTAYPLARAKDLPLYKYDINTLNLEAFLKQNSGKRLLIVGHSNTTPQFVNAIIGKETYPQIADNNNSNLYIVTVANDLATSSLIVVD
ncbi:MAG: histidine phosphatase family protein [Bacteroidia bacterium]|nr:histidine phosphatase family protein [Bacteroidia bacterium]NND11860.1 histidine phosphatase family protein [Flavobacteriaceae bacterium]NNK28239.1 histidine phosphatase family protein [Flavobacteriaceae bacterium]